MVYVGDGKKTSNRQAGAIAISLLLWSCTVLIGLGVLGLVDAREHGRIMTRSLPTRGWGRVLLYP